MSIITVRSKDGVRTHTVTDGENLLQALVGFGYTLNVACGGRGTCGKCCVKVVEGATDLTPDDEGYVLSCEATVIGDVSLELDEYEGSGLLSSRTSYSVAEGEGGGLGVAVDIGTTTVATYLLDMASGNILSRRSCLNPQIVAGADVISRIDACKSGRLQELCGLIRAKLSEYIREFATRFGEIGEVVCTGNTVMMHLLAGENPESIGAYPFTPIFLESRVYSGEELGIPANRVVLMPSYGSYVGADLVSGTVATSLMDGNNVLVDLGTNGEIVVHSDKLSATATAAGPAFEGANITCGTGGIEGAISSVDADGRIETIGGAEPIGICGSGLIDAIAYMRSHGIIDEYGTFEEGEEYPLTDKVSVNQRDVREFQLAKAAVRAGIEIAIKRAGLTYDMVDNLYIAGGMGFYMNIDSAISIGLIPSALRDRIRVVGNAAGEGAIMALLDDGLMKRAETLATECDCYDLSMDPEFMDEYVERMNLDE